MKYLYTTAQGQVFTFFSKVKGRMYYGNCAVTCVGIGIVCIAVFTSIAAFILAPLPNITDSTAWQPKQSITFTDRNNKEMYYAYDAVDRIYVEPEVIPLVVKQAFIAIEDKRFYERGCIDWRALARAVRANLTDFKSQGASTITQQLVRTVHLNREKKLLRKARELVLACQLEHVATKDEILHLYINWIPFGGGIAGVQQASKQFFGKSVQDISLAEAAILAALPQRPTYYSPYGPHRYTQLSADLQQQLHSGGVIANAINSKDVKIGLTGTAAIIQNVDGTGSVLIGGRAHQVLQHMVEQGFITPQQKLLADQELIHLKFAPNVRSIVAPHYVMTTLSSVEALLLNETQKSEGVTIQSTIDNDLQLKAEAIVQEHIQEIRKKFKAQNVALLLADVHSGEVLAYIGNTNYFDSSSGAKIDMVRVPRQPGSSFKPIVYAAAMLHGNWQPYTMVTDLPITKGEHSPQNYDNAFKGSISVMKALNYSRNIPAIKAFDEAKGEENVLNLASKLGAKTPKLQRIKQQKVIGSYDYGWPLAIGAAETPLFEMVQAYSTFANQGLYTPLTNVRSIRAADGSILYTPEMKAKELVLPNELAQTMTSMLSEWRSRPIGYWQTITNLPDIHETLKTGTSNVCYKQGKQGCEEMYPRDLWAIGYTPEFIVGVWVGNADSTPLAPKANGLEAAVPIWREVLLAAHASKENASTLFAGKSRPYFSQHALPKPKKIEANPLQQRPAWIGMQ